MTDISLDEMRVSFELRREPRDHAAVSTLPLSTKPDPGEVRSARRIVEPGEESHES